MQIPMEQKGKLEVQQGGPYDRYVLCCQWEQVSRDIREGGICLPVNLFCTIYISLLFYFSYLIYFIILSNHRWHLKCINNWQRIIPMNTRRGGLANLITIRFNIFYRGLLTTFSERWQEERSTFHLPVREMTMTLGEVSCLLYLPIQIGLFYHTIVKKEE